MNLIGFGSFGLEQVTSGAPKTTKVVSGRTSGGGGAAVASIFGPIAASFQFLKSSLLGVTVKGISATKAPWSCVATDPASDPTWMYQSKYLIPPDRFNSEGLPAACMTMVVLDDNSNFRKAVRGELAKINKAYGSAGSALLGNLLVDVVAQVSDLSVMDSRRKIGEDYFNTTASYLPMPATPPPAPGYTIGAQPTSATKSPAPGVTSPERTPTALPTAEPTATPVTFGPGPDPSADAVPIVEYGVQEWGTPPQPQPKDEGVELFREVKSDAKTITYVLVGAGVLTVLGVAYLATRKK